MTVIYQVNNYQLLLKIKEKVSKKTKSNRCLSHTVKVGTLPDMKKNVNQNLGCSIFYNDNIRRFSESL